MITFELKTQRDAGEVCAELEKIIGQRVGTSVSGGTQVEIDAELTPEQLSALAAACEAIEAQPKPKTLEERIAELEGRLAIVEKAR